MDNKQIKEKFFAESPHYISYTKCLKYKIGKGKYKTDICLARIPEKIKPGDYLHLILKIRRKNAILTKRYLDYAERAGAISLIEDIKIGKKCLFFRMRYPEKSEQAYIQICAVRNIAEEMSMVSSIVALCGHGVEFYLAWYIGTASVYNIGHQPINQMFSTINNIRRDCIVFTDVPIAMKMVSNGDYKGTSGRLSSSDLIYSMINSQNTKKLGDILK